MSIENDYIMETKEPELMQEELLYNCTECSSPIEILLINEDECLLNFNV
jgi:DNA-directed RNA polymerase subunit RPC12/RpoP